MVGSEVAALAVRLAVSCGSSVASQACSLTCQSVPPRGKRALGKIHADHGTVEIGTYPFMHQDRFGTILVLSSVDHDAIDEAAEVTSRGVEGWTCSDGARIRVGATRMVAHEIRARG